MVFPSIEFAIFFPIVLVGSWALMSRPPWWKAFVLFASYVFYCSANPKLGLLLAGVTLANQAGAHLIHRSKTENGRKWWKRATVGIDLLVLGIFKYYGFFTDEVNGLLNDFHMGLPIPVANVILPIGISFYTFQSISYTVDVYRRIIEPCKTIDLAVYLSFFPHVVAGPIVRAREILPQIAEPRDPRDVRVGPAFTLIAIGLVKKVIIADFVGREVVQKVLTVPQGYHTPDVLLGFWGFTVQVYCDFSGYTDIAIGVALLMGIVFPQNFNRPFSASSFQDFWRRWHITLVRFLRDYVYIPMGGNRVRESRAALNAFTLMTLAGLWHGAGWPFLIWGASAGAALAIEGLLRPRFKPPPTFVGWFIVYNWFALGGPFFGSPSIQHSWDIIKSLFDWGPATLWHWPVVIAIFGVVALQNVPPRFYERPRMALERASPVLLGAVLAVVVIIVSATVPSGGVPPFIYFRF
jgi:alginate O-acetyltransferase complex protein AlgI